jgi:virginiamycin A acetyltransferase
MHIHVNNMILSLRLKSIIRKLVKHFENKSKKIYISRGSYVHPNTVIGKCTRINRVSHIGECRIGSYCAIGGRLVVRSTDHFTNFLNVQEWAQRNVIGSDVPVSGKSKGSVEIGNAVWIGDSVIVLPGVKIGDGAVIGAGSVVTKSVPAYAVAAGNPAQVIKRRFSEDIIEVLSDVKWWEWDEALMKERCEFFETDLTLISIVELRRILKEYGVVT